MRFKAKQLVLILLLSFCLLIPNMVIAGKRTSKAERLYQNARKNYLRLYDVGKFRKYRSNWLRTVQKFEDIYKLYPKSRQASQSLFNIGHLYRSLYKWNKKDIYIDQSNIAFRTLVNEYPKSSLADDSQLKLAENFEIFKKDTNLAYLAYQELVNRYPRRDSAKIARAKLKTLRAPPVDIRLFPQDKEDIIAFKNLRIPKFGGISEEKSKKQNPIRIKSIKYWSTSDWSRIVINTIEPVRYKYQALNSDPKLKKDKRIYLDFYQSFIADNIKKRISANDGLIKQLRIAQFNKSTVRIVLDLASLRKIKVFDYKISGQNKIIIDILGRSSEVWKLMARNQKVIKKGQNTKVIPRNHHSTKIGKYNGNHKTTLAQALGLKVGTIILDPGHGGKDPGAIGFRTYEKDLTLKLAKVLKKIILKKHPKMKVLLTRDKDEYISLEARTAFANKHKGDIFISLHINATENGKASGMETFFLNFTTDDSSLALAAKENQSSLKTVSDLQGILNDLMTSSKIKESNDLAKNIQFSMVQRVQRRARIKIRNLGVKQAPFLVLIGAKMPSILVEAGFITNKKENRRLRSSRYQRHIAEGIYTGVLKYIKSNHMFVMK